MNDRHEQDEYVASRLDVWKTAQVALVTAQWPSEAPAVDAQDALNLAKFLAGDDTAGRGFFAVDDDGYDEDQDEFEDDEEGEGA